MHIVDHSPHQADPSSPIPSASNVVLVDNYDSFTWNVYQYLVLEGATVSVLRNDHVTLDELMALQPTHLVISPGPGHPKTDAGVSLAAIQHFAGKIPIFGVCMGLLTRQCMVFTYGGDISFAGEILHGKTSPIHHDSRGVFSSIAQNIPATRYHSLSADHVSLPPVFEISAHSTRADGQDIIMGVRHREFVMEGVQFHPESILSAAGRQMIRNFLLLSKGTWADESAAPTVSAASAAPSTSTAAAVESATTSSSKPPTVNILQQIYQHRRQLVLEQKSVPSLRPLDLQAAHAAHAVLPVMPVLSRLRRSPYKTALMAEIKRASPSKGVFDLGINASALATKYAKAGASVISVLTEPKWFRGSMNDLRQVRLTLQTFPDRPAVLCKDFIFDEYQILEARLAGADTVLLIVKMLVHDADGEADAALLPRLYAYSQRLGMEPLVEVQNADEMRLAVGLGARLIGVNNRNLESFVVDLKTTSQLRPLVPPATVLCALSGISSRADVAVYEEQGVQAILVGEALVKASDAATLARYLCGGLGGEAESVAASAPASDVTLATRATMATLPLLDPGKMSVKMCGLGSADDAQAAMDAGADLLGIILVPGAKRCVSDHVALQIGRVVRKFRDREDIARDDRDPEPPRLVGVFKDQPLHEILRLQRRYQLDIVQLHGSEPVEWARHIPAPVIRRFSPADISDMASIDLGPIGYHAAALLDPGAGSGELFDRAAFKNALATHHSVRPLLAGGLTSENLVSVFAGLGKYADRILGVDVSSGVEVDGKKDASLMRHFVNTARSLRKPS